MLLVPKHNCSNYRLGLPLQIDGIEIQFPILDPTTYIQAYVTFNENIDET